MQSQLQTMTVAQWMQLILLSLIWGGTFILTVPALEGFAPIALVAWRLTIAALNLLLVCWLLHISLRPLLSHGPRLIMLAALNNAVPFFLISTGQTVIGAGMASIFNSTTPLWTALIAAFLLRNETLRGLKLFGILTGILGVAVLLGPAAVAGLGGPPWAMACLVGAAISYGFGANLARGLDDLPPILIATGQCLCSSILVMVTALVTVGPDGMVTDNGSAIASVFVIGTLMTAGAYLLYFNLISKAGATNGSLVTILIPVSAVLAGMALFGEEMTVNGWMGFALISFGLLMIDGRLFKKRLRQVTPIA
ncbi:DMT family transporter [Notoacmeibacter sp. MSK16QG-6]|uniref:DMT family transporter n=1 Tax=Notoacmeibacter sp. MSK16QG-6 TaxID=2957982 RepID=UPI00209E8322|nr:DMT family transporter [Notoacmeibacter sp. MSK16QG-6]MCP1199725.1 DMT family transporter [Notoacmeibacter sp. MSK16QG-6]